MTRHRSLPPVLLAAVLVLVLASNATALAPGGEAPESSSWSALSWNAVADWLAQSRAGVAAAWNAFSTGGGDFGLGLDPDGTDPDPADGGGGDGSGDPPPPDDPDSTTTEPAPTP